MTTEGEGSELLAQNELKYFLVQWKDSYFLVSEVERYRKGDDHFKLVEEQFTAGYVTAKRQAPGTPLKRGDVQTAAQQSATADGAEARLSEGAITLQFVPGDT